MNVRWHEAARREFHKDLLRYADRSVAVALRFKDEVDSTVKLIARSPAIFQQIQPGCRRAPLRSFPYGIIFKEQSAGILLIAVAHGKRRPGYWHKRQ